MMNTVLLDYRRVQIRAFVWGMWVGAKVIVVIYLLTEGVA